jgi:hypothetical protein
VDDLMKIHYFYRTYVQTETENTMDVMSVVLFICFYENNQEKGIIITPHHDSIMMPMTGGDDDDSCTIIDEKKSINKEQKNDCCGNDSSSSSSSSSSSNNDSKDVSRTFERDDSSAGMIRAGSRGPLIDSSIRYSPYERNNS